MRLDDAMAVYSRGWRPDALEAAKVIYAGRMFDKYINVQRKHVSSDFLNEN